MSLRLRHGVLDGVTIDAKPGERIALFGRQGSGKSVLLALLSGRSAPESGDIQVLGAAPAECGARMASLIQPYGESLSGTPRQQIASALARARTPASQRPARLAEALHAAGLFERAEAPVRELTETDGRSLQIARTVAHRPDVILLDDILRLLAPQMRERWWSYLEERCRNDGATLVFSTLDAREAERADRVVLLDGGRMLAFDEPRALLSRCAREEIIVEADDEAAVESTLRGVRNVEILSSEEGVSFFAKDGAAAAATVFRHPPKGLRSVFVRRADLWDCIDALGY